MISAPQRAETCHREGVKTDAERGPWGAWAYNARARFPELTAPQVARAIGYSEGALRKVEAGSPGQNPPARPLRRKLAEYYMRLAAERGVVIDPPPSDVGHQLEPEPELMADVLRELVGEVRLSRVAQETVAQALGELAGMVAALLARADMRVGPTPPGGDGTPQV